MKEKNIGSIIIADENKRPIGIITDSDLRKKVATGDFPITAKAKEIMSSPVYTLLPNISASEAIIHMMSKNIRHLVLTEDGTPNTPIFGIVSEHDVLVLHGNNPAVLVKEIQNTEDSRKLSLLRARADKLLKDYIDQEVSIQFVANTISEINDALIKKAIDISIKRLEEEGIKKPEVSFAWLSLGSEGRKEQLLKTDQDNAIVYEDPPENLQEEVRNYFLKLGNSVNKILVEAGFSECPADIMAKNPKWCQPLQKWKEYFKTWMEIPDEKNVMQTTIFFDFRAVYGNKNLAEELKKYIYQLKNPLFLGLLAKSAVSNPPPLNFFRNLIVEKSGEHKDEFDLKARCTMPLIDAARVLCLEREALDVHSTIERYQKLMELEPENKQVYQSAIESFSVYLRFRTMQGLKHGDTGRYIKLEELTKLEKQLLKNTFSAIEEVQKILKAQFKLDNL
jgi:CBS domain-containing protein